MPENSNLSDNFNGTLPNYVNESSDATKSSVEIQALKVLVKIAQTLVKGLPDFAGIESLIQF